jgi:hypothetical protein
MASCWNDNMTKCQVDEMASWLNVKLKKWQVGEMSSWQNDLSLNLLKLGSHGDTKNPWKQDKHKPLRVFVNFLTIKNGQN